MAYPETLKKGNPGGQGGGHNCSARTASRGKVARRGDKPQSPHTSKLTAI